METVHLLTLLSFFTVLQQVRSWIISVPTTVTAVEGSCVVVPCQTEPHSRVTWYQYHSRHYPVVYDEQLARIEGQFRGRTFVLGEAAEGNCTLTISNVKVADNNLKVYVWINPDSKPTQQFHLQTVTIFVERKAPIISIQERILDGEFFQANCSINLYSCPFSSPSLHWNISQFPKNSTSVTFNENVQGRWSYTQTLQGPATYEMHNSTMWCSAKFGTFTTESRQITLNILYEPVTVTLILEKEPIVEGGSITIECAANCNPQPHRYIWLQRQMGQNNETTSSERKRLFNNIRRDTSLSCIAHNDIGTGKSAWLDLDVQYSPKHTTVSVHPSGPVPEDSNVTLTCSSTANPAVRSYTWYRADGGQETVIGTGHDLTIKASKDNSSFFCMAENDIGAERSNNTHIDVQYPPKHTTVTVHPSGPVPEDSTATLTRSSTANPAVRSYTCYRADRGQETVIGTGHDLIIKASKDNSSFICKAENDIGAERSNLSQIDVPNREQHCGPYGGILLLGVAGVSLSVNILYTVCLVFLCKARKNVKPKEEDTTYMSLNPIDSSPEYDVIGYTPK